MKERVALTNSNKLFNNKNLQTNALNQTINIFQKKDEMLFGQKSFLQIILGLIKNAQVDYLSNQKSLENKSINNSSDSKNISHIKSILNDLKKNLKEIKIEKEKTIKLYEDLKEKKDLNLKNKIFNSIKSNRYTTNFDYINSNYETLVTENGENCFNKETPELKILNFKIENKIQELENIIRRKLYIIEYYKTPHIFDNHRTEVLCKNNKDFESMDQLLHQQLIQQRNNFIEAVNRKSIQNNKMNNFRSQIIVYKAVMKDYDAPYKFVETKDVISEESQSYIETINDEEKIIDNLKHCKDLTMDNDINTEDIKNNINNLKNLKLLNMNDIEKILNLNMNINVNINYNNQYINNHFEKSQNKNNEENCSSSNCSKNESNEDNISNVDKLENL